MSKTDLVEKAREFYKQHVNGCYRPTYGTEASIPSIMAAFARSLNADAVKEKQRIIAAIEEMKKRLAGYRVAKEALDEIAAIVRNHD